MTQLRFETDGPLAIVTLSNPPQNRFMAGMSGDLAAVLNEVEKSRSRALLLRADGPDFCFGGEIGDWPGMTDAQLRERFGGLLAVFNRFENLAIPTIAAVQGHCLGGGLELAVRADILIAGQSAVFGHPEQSLGLIALLGGVYRVAAKAGRAKAMEWALTSELVSAAEMERHGVVNRVVPDAALADESLAFTRRVASGPTLAHAAHKSLLAAWTAGGIAAADAMVLETTMNLFASDDLRMAVPGAIDALAAGKPRPVFDFKGR